jgi:transcriptional regulator with XRE-family HTH domain
MKVARIIAKVRKELQKALAEEKNSRRLTQADLARTIGVDRSVINRQLIGMGTENLTLSRIAELAWALDREVVFSLARPEEAVGANEIVEAAKPTVSVKATAFSSAAANVTPVGRSTIPALRIPA